MHLPKKSATCGLVQIDESGLCPVLAEAAPEARQIFLLAGLCANPLPGPLPLGRKLTDTPAGRKLSLASRGDWLWHFQGWPGLVDLSKTPGGTFFSGGAPDLGNGTSKSPNRDVFWRFVAIRAGAVWDLATPRTPRSCGGPRGSLSVRPLRLAGLRELQPRLARASLESANYRTGACQHHTVASCDGREKSTGGAGSPVVVGWADLARSAAPRPRPGGLHLLRSNRWLLPLRMARCVCE